MSPVFHLSLSLDDSGQPRAAWPGDPTVPQQAHTLTEFLSADLTHNLDYCTRILAEAARLERGDSANWHTTGNAFSLNLGPTHTRIQALFPPDAPDPRSCTLPTREFVEIIAAWRDLTERARTATS